MFTLFEVTNDKTMLADENGHQTHNILCDAGCMSPAKYQDLGSRDTDRLQILINKVSA